MVTSKDCFQGFYDLWGGEAGDTIFNSIDVGQNGEFVLVCGYSASNKDGFVQFDNSYADSRPLIGVFNKYLDARWMKQYQEQETWAYPKPYQSQMFADC